MLAACSADSCISASSALLLLAYALGCFGAGYGVGHMVLWVRRLGEVA